MHEPALAVAIVLRQAGQVLLIRRAAGVPRAGFWSPPTGRVEPGESLAAAVVREAREELNIEVRALNDLWQCATDDGRYQLHWWSVEWVGGTIKANPREVAEWRWIAAEQFGELHPTFAAHRGFFERDSLHLFDDRSLLDDTPPAVRGVARISEAHPGKPAQEAPGCALPNEPPPKQVG